MTRKTLASQADTKRFDPDARFLLANERTLLAWIRTALALLAGGLALTQLNDKGTTQTTLGLAVICLGGVMTLVGFIRYMAADRAIRQGVLPSTGLGPAVQTAIIVVIATGLIVTHFLGVW